ncbi:MAG: glycosyltransferase family 2 protein [Proteobacteria bacterium]|nr:glycosyltransferase family 2 protein [Pseudomonadota bacterium]
MGRTEAGSAADLAVVIPVHNEQANIGPLIEEVDRAFAGSPWRIEIVVVNDGSTDGTAGVLRAAGVGRPHLRIVDHRRNRGQSASLLSGVTAASAAWIATLDGDGQNDPADLPALWARIADGGARRQRTMIAGHRRDRKDTWLRRTSSRIANAVRWTLLRDHTPDTGCGLKIFERQMFLSLPHFDHFHRFLPALARRAGGEVESVPVRHRPRLSGASHYGVGNRLWVGLVDVLGVLWLGRRAEPWRVDADTRSVADRREAEHPDAVHPEAEHKDLGE